MEDEFGNRALELTANFETPEKYELGDCFGHLAFGVKDLEEFAKKYFTYCGIKTKDLIGKEVECVLAKRSYEKDGEARVVNYIKYLNVLDENGNAIYLPKEDTNSEIDF